MQYYLQDQQLRQPSAKSVSIRHSFCQLKSLPQCLARRASFGREEFAHKSEHRYYSRKNIMHDESTVKYVLAKVQNVYDLVKKTASKIPLPDFPLFWQDEEQKCKTNRERDDKARCMPNVRL